MRYWSAMAAGSYLIVSGAWTSGRTSSTSWAFDYSLSGWKWPSDVWSQ